MAKKRIAIAVTSMVVIFSFGLATIVIPPTLEGLPWQSGLIVASPMIASSVAPLIFVGINYRKLKNSNIKKETMKEIQSRSTTTRKPIGTGLGAVGFGLALIGIIMVLVPVYPKYTDITLLIGGISLLVAPFIVRRTYIH